MADIVDKATRSKMMSGIRAKDTKPEIIIRKLLHREGFRFRLHLRKMPGNPDIVLPKHKLCIFVHGCFWHHHQGCKYAYLPKTRRKFWESKFRENMLRDRVNQSKLISSGWRVMVIWECYIKSHTHMKIISAISDGIRSEIVSLHYP